MPEPVRRFRIEFAAETKKEFRKLGHAAAVELLSAIEKKLCVDPEGYGNRLRDDLKGYYKLAVSNWRVVYYIEDELVTVLVLAVGKRAEGDHENIYEQITRDALDARRATLNERLGSEAPSELTAPRKGRRKR